MTPSVDSLDLNSSFYQMSRANQNKKTVSYSTPEFPEDLALRGVFASVKDSTIIKTIFNT